MKGDTQAIHYLNQVLANELLAINQYFLHSYILKNQGFLKLAAHARNESIEEMKHAESLVERILFLDGTPQLNGPTKLQISRKVIEIFTADLQFEFEAIALFKEAIAYLDSIRDFQSSQLLKTILANEEEHVDWLETQLNLIEALGEQGYLQTQL